MIFKKEINKARKQKWYGMCLLAKGPDLCVKAIWVWQ